MKCVDDGKQECLPGKFQYCGGIIRCPTPNYRTLLNKQNGDDYMAEQIKKDQPTTDLFLIDINTRLEELEKSIYRLNSALEEPQLQCASNNCGEIEPCAILLNDKLQKIASLITRYQVKISDIASKVEDSLGNTKLY